MFDNIHQKIDGIGIVMKIHISARYQGAVCVWAGSLWVIGGCDAWHCLGTTEIFRDIASLTSSEPGSWHPGKYD